jgi:hypothetical protein
LFKRSEVSDWPSTFAKASAVALGASAVAKASVVAKAMPDGMADGMADKSARQAETADDRLSSDCQSGLAFLWQKLPFNIKVG